MTRHTILGAGGVIGRQLAALLPAYGDRVRLVSRHPEKINPTDELMSADLKDAVAVDKAVEESDVVYLTAGLPYRLPVWRQDWPAIMGNVITACLRHHAGLIFFDNIYCYGRVGGPIREDCPLVPSSEKGKVRVQLTRMLENAWKSSGLKGAIVRSADFYGRGADNAAFTSLVADRLKGGKKAQWLCNDRVRYSMTYAPDAALGTTVIGHDPNAWQQVWHLPTSTEEVTAADLIGQAVQLASAPSGRLLLGKNMLRLAGLFDKTVRELVEMTYQYEYDYIFDSSKFEAYFKLQPTPYREGLQQALDIKVL